jgi:hypothetical protein
MVVLSLQTLDSRSWEGYLQRYIIDDCSGAQARAENLLPLFGIFLFHYFFWRYL